MLAKQEIGREHQRYLTSHLILSHLYLHLLFICILLNSIIFNIGIYPYFLPFFLPLVLVILYFLFFWIYLSNLVLSEEDFDKDIFKLIIISTFLTAQLYCIFRNHPSPSFLFIFTVKYLLFFSWYLSLRLVISISFPLHIPLPIQLFLTISLFLSLSSSLSLSLSLSLSFSSTISLSLSDGQYRRASNADAGCPCSFLSSYYT